jgi:hypothetical protein
MKVFFKLGNVNAFLFAFVIAKGKADLDGGPPVCVASSRAISVIL